MQNIEIGDVIARGGHSTLRIGRNRDTFESVAVKEIDLEVQYGMALYKNEVRILKAMAPHRNVPKFHSSSISSSEGVARVALEYIPFPDMTTFIEENGPLPENSVALIVSQMIDTWEHLRKSNVAHRDWKSDNIMINPSNLHIKLIDFGLGSSIAKDATSVESIGTPIYMAPEVLNVKKAFDISLGDLWSIGVIGLELLMGQQPFKKATDRKMLSKMQKKDKSSALSRCSQPLRDLLLALLEKSPRKRLQALTKVKLVKASLVKMAAPESPVPKKLLHCPRARTAPLITRPIEVGA